MGLPEMPQRPGGDTEALEVSLAGDTFNVAPATDPHCCAALTFDERETAARFAIHCGVDRCARTVLRGDDR